MAQLFRTLPCLLHIDATRAMIRIFAAALLLPLLSASPAPPHITYTVTNSTALPWTIRVNWVNASNVTSVTTQTAAANQNTTVYLPGACVAITAVRVLIPANSTVRAVAGCDTKTIRQFDVNNCQCPGYAGHRFSVNYDHWDCSNCDQDAGPCPYQCGTGTCNFRGCTITQAS